MAHDDVKVLYIAGTGRSGSTVLANICGQIDGWFSAGEVRYLWERGLRQDRLCGCGEPFSQCPTWTAILAAAFEDALPDPDHVGGLLAATTRLRHAVRLPASGASKPEGPAAELAAILAKLYRAIAAVTGARVVVDSSKLPSYGRLLSAVDGIDLRVVHLVRDPRAAAWSWLRKKELTDRAAQSHMEQIGPAKSSLLWDVWNRAADHWWPETAGGPNLVVRYEDFVAAPRDTVGDIVALCGDPEATLPFVDARTVELGPTHTVAGNPDRMRSGPTTLRADDAWLTEMPWRDRALVSAVTAPQRRRYGYGRPDGASGSGTAEAPLPHDAGTWSRNLTRVKRHWHWGRTQGFDRLVEEDNLDPVERVRVAVAKARWRRSHGVELGTATPVWLVGVQRSGTNMVVRGLETSPEFEVHNENDRAAFERFELRPDPVVSALVAESRHRYVLFKPLCDSHRTADLLDDITAGSPGRAIWAYRSVDARARSAVVKFGDVNLRVLRRIADGDGDDLWQAQRLSAESRALLAEVDFDALTPLDGAALFWCVRNRLFFEQGLDERDDVRLVSYEGLVADPEGVMGAVCEFLDFEYTDHLVDHVERRDAVGAKPLELDPTVRRRCDELTARLNAAAVRAKG